MYRRFFVDTLHKLTILPLVRPEIPLLFMLSGLFSGHDVTPGQPGRTGTTAGRLPGLPVRVACRNFSLAVQVRVLVTLTISIQKTQLMDWVVELERARKDGGLLISKVSPPSGSTCDHKESTWEFHKKKIKDAMEKCDFVITYETKTLVSISPRRVG